ncbi:MAG TPA: DUF3891 family protein [Bacillales bacterium]|nr:DUF3891 family protein [Bacillales bacterium]
MIIRETDNFFILIHQHDHGLLAGEIANYWGNANFTEPPHRLVLTAALHDLSWIESDTQLHWNDKENRPYDFTSLPLETRLPMYEKGLDKTEKITPYGGLLVSSHYSSFFKEEQGEEVRQFLKKEENRRGRWKEKFFDKPLDSDLHQLQLWDNLSLYICLNPPGTHKEQEHPWFKNGIQAVTKDEQKVTIHLRWLNERTVALEPYPFKKSWSTTLPYAKVRKSLGPDDPDVKKTFRQYIRFVPE